MKTKYSILISLFAVSFIFAQKVKIQSASGKYNDLAYVNAIDIYEKVAEKGYESTELFQKLGNSYYFNGKLIEAGKWYQKLIDLDQNVDPEYFYRYAQCLKAKEDYKKANEYLDKFTEKIASQDKRAKLIKDNKNYITDIKKLNPKYTIENAGINSIFSDYGAAFYKDQIVFASSRDSGSVSNVKSTWTNQSFSNLYTSKVNNNGTLEKPLTFSKRINSKFHESTPVFTKDGQTMYFTRNNFINGKKGTDNDKITLLKLYKATYNGTSWDDVEELPFNSDQYSVAHPALSPDEKTLYFASNMPGTIGQSDIFKVKINEDGTFGKPENLGVGINTEARETFPFIADDNVLYFASDGQLGLGGLDIFAVKLKKDGSIVSTVLNLGAPINSSLDDFAFIIDKQNEKGFFSSNRKEGLGFDDIYTFKQIEKQDFDCQNKLTGYLIDSETSEILKNTKIILLDNAMKTIAEMTTNNEGKYIFENVECDKIFYIRGIADGYEVVEKYIKTLKITGEIETILPVNKIEKKITVGTDLAKTFNLEIIYFDLDKATIRKDAAVELAKIVEVMKQNPSITIDIRSHTDSRQTQDYNNKLSEKRAQATKKWIIKNGISPNRLTAKGYGETQLVNNCTDNINCSEEQHQANRRSEFIITKI